MTAAIAALALKRRPSNTEIGIGLGVTAVYLMVLLRMAIPEERTHPSVATAAPDYSPFKV